jgi:hypothetical protein
VSALSFAASGHCARSGSCDLAFRTKPQQERVGFSWNELALAPLALFLARLVLIFAPLKREIGGLLLIPAFTKQELPLRHQNAAPTEIQFAPP